MSHSITLSTAVAMTSRYRQHREQILIPSQQNKNLLPLCESFDKAAIIALLDQPGCVTFRIYYGMDDELKLHAILVAADASNSDILPPYLASQTTEDEVILDAGIRCPPTCPPPSPLNEP